MGVPHPLRVSVVLAALVLVTSCSHDETGLARVGSRHLEIPPFQKYIGEASGEAWPGVNARVASGLLDQYIDRQVVIEAARQHEILAKTDIPQLEPGEMRRILDQLCGPAPEPASEAVEQEVARRLGESLPAQAHVRQILVDSLEEAENARRRLDEGEDFVEVSREVSRAPNAMDGGELGVFYQGSLPEEIDKVVFSLASGAISKPVQGPSGYHIFQVLETIPAGPPNAVTIERTVMTELAEQGARDHTRQCIERLASEIGVEVKSSNLWFAYDGKYAEDRIDA